MSILRFALLILLTIFLNGCGSVTPIPSYTTKINPTSAPQEIQTPVSVPTLVESFHEKLEHIYDITISRDKQDIAVFTTSGIYLYDSATLTQKQFIEVKSKVSAHFFHRLMPSITFTPDGNKLVFSKENWILSWDLINNKENDNLYLSFSAIPDWNISKIEYSPKGDRIMITTTGGYDKCDGTGVNFALYDDEFNLLLDRYFCTDYSENYYRFTLDNKLFIFYNARSMFFPIEFYEIELSTANVMKKVKYDLKSGNAENFIYDVSLNGQFLAIGNYSNNDFKTKVVDSNSDNTVQEIDGGVDFSLDGIGKMRKSNLNEGINEKCGIVNKPDEGKQYTILTSNDEKAVLTVSDWYPFMDERNIKFLELWDLSRCEIEKAITFPSVQ